MQPGRIAQEAHNHFCVFVPFCGDTSSSVAANQSFTVMSQLPVTSVRPSGEKATAATRESWPVNVARSWPVFGSQSFMVLSSPPVATVLPPGEKATAETSNLCPTSSTNCCAVVTSQSFIVLSLLALASFFASFEKATDRIPSL